MKLRIFCSRFNEPSSTIEIANADQVFIIKSQNTPFTYREVQETLVDLTQLCAKNPTPINPFDVIVEGEDALIQKDHLYKTKLEY